MRGLLFGAWLLSLPGTLGTAAASYRELGPPLPSVADIERELAAQYGAIGPPGIAVITATGATKCPTVDDEAAEPLSVLPSSADVERLLAPACDVMDGAAGCAVLTAGYSRLRGQEGGVPAYLECDACGAIAWQLRDGIRRAEVPEGAPPGTVNLFPEKLWWRHRDNVYADVCRPSTFATYALEAIELDGGETGWVLDGEGAEGAEFAGVRMKEAGFLSEAMAERCSEIVREVGRPELHFLLVGAGASGSAVDDALRASVCTDASRWCESRDAGSDSAPADSSSSAGSAHGQRHKQKHRRKHRRSAREAQNQAVTFGAESAEGVPASPVVTVLPLDHPMAAAPSVMDPWRGGDECDSGWTGPDCLECTAGFSLNDSGFCERQSRSDISR
jgi:hypothetical protein